MAQLPTSHVVNKSALGSSQSSKGRKSPLSCVSFWTLVSSLFAHLDMHTLDGPEEESWETDHSHFGNSRLGSVVYTARAGSRRFQSGHQDTMPRRRGRQYCLLRRSQRSSLQQQKQKQGNVHVSKQSYSVCVVVVVGSHLRRQIAGQDSLAHDPEKSTPADTIGRSPKTASVETKDKNIMVDEVTKVEVNERATGDWFRGGRDVGATKKRLATFV